MRQHGCVLMISSPDNVPLTKDIPSLIFFFFGFEIFFKNIYDCYLFYLGFLQELEYKLPAIGFEDFFRVAVGWHETGDFVPEGSLVVAESEVGEFVDNDVLGDDSWGEEDAGVDDDAVFRSTAPPFAFLKPDAELRGFNIREGYVAADNLFKGSCADSPVEHDDHVPCDVCLVFRGKVVGDVDDESIVQELGLCRTAGVSGDGVFVSEEGKGFAVGVAPADFWLFGVFLYLRCDPPGFGFDEFSDVFGRNVLWHADDDGGIGFDFDCPGFSAVAVDYGVGYFLFAVLDCAGACDFFGPHVNDYLSVTPI